MKAPTFESVVSRFALKIVDKAVECFIDVHKDDLSMVTLEENTQQV